MGYARPRPKRLAEKLLFIRNALGLSQTELWRQLGVEDEIPFKRISKYELDQNEPPLFVLLQYFEIPFKRISKYELDQNEPPLFVLLQYARIAGVPTEVLIDDELDLPERLPGTTDHEEIRRKFTARSGRAGKTKAK